MMTTATHTAHNTTMERVLFMAFELSENTWKLGFTTGHGQKPRERTMGLQQLAPSCYAGNEHDNACTPNVQGRKVRVRLA